MYITLAEIKKHLNIDTAFTDDDNYLQALEAAGEELVSKYTNRDLADTVDVNNNIPPSLKHAILLWIGTAYAVRESTSSTVQVPVPHAFDLLCDAWRKYSDND